MRNKSILVTGANGGLGFSTVKALATANVGRVLMATRDFQSAIDAKDKLLAQIETTTTIDSAGGFDMTQAQAINAAVAALPTGKPFDTVFFQAGGATFGDKYSFIEYGQTQVERTVFQNAIGGYITLIHLLERGLVTHDARIVFMGGENARGVPGMNEPPVFESAESYRRFITGEGNLREYSPMYSMGVSKLSSALLAQKLAQRNDGRAYLWFSPGLTHGTQGFTKGPVLQRFFVNNVMTKITALLGMSQSPDQGGQRCADCLLGEVGENGDILGVPSGKLLGRATDQKPLNPSFTQQPLIDTLWNMLQSVHPMP